VDEFKPILGHLFSAAGIIVIEHGSVEEAEDAENMFNSLSTGKITVEDAMTQWSSESYLCDGFHEIGPTYDRTLFEMIAGSHKRIYVEHSPLTRAQLDRSIAAPNLTMNPLDEHYLRDYLRTYEERLCSRATAIRVRDKQFALQLGELSKQNPKSHILVPRGVGHQDALERFLTEQGLSFESRLSDERARLLMETEVLRKMAAGLQVERRQLLLAVVQSLEIDRLCGKSMFRMADVVKTYDIVATMSESELESKLHRLSLGY
jgi:hypothetical protein